VSDIRIISVINTHHLTPVINDRIIHFVPFSAKRQGFCSFSPRACIYVGASFADYLEKFALVIPGVTSSKPALSLVGGV